MSTVPMTLLWSTRCSLRAVTSTRDSSDAANELYAPTVLVMAEPSLVARSPNTANRSYSSRDRSNSIFASSVRLCCCHAYATDLSTAHRVIGEVSATFCANASSISVGSVSNAACSNDSLGMNAITKSGASLNAFQ